MLRRVLNRYVWEGVLVLTSEWVGIVFYGWHPPVIIGLANFIFISWCCVKAQDTRHG